MDYFPLYYAIAHLAQLATHTKVKERDLFLYDVEGAADESESERERQRGEEKNPIHTPRIDPCFSTRPLNRDKQQPAAGISNVS